ncbi:putative transcription initiation factor Rrn7, Zinc-finger [Helianthus annuus]|nr:putative transcription initiation factor Rrn7, Zinc-finger [Helianthus annuus]
MLVPFHIMIMMANGLVLSCQVCGSVAMEDGSDGFLYCQQCGSQDDGIRATVVDDAEMPLSREVLEQDGRDEEIQRLREEITHKDYNLSVADSTIQDLNDKLHQALETTAAYEGMDVKLQRARKKLIKRGKDLVDIKTALVISKDEYSNAMAQIALLKADVDYRKAKVKFLKGKLKILRQEHQEK